MTSPSPEEPVSSQPPEHRAPADLPPAQPEVVNTEADADDVGNRFDASDEAEPDDADGNRAERIPDNAARGPRPRGRRRRGRGGNDKGDRGQGAARPPGNP